MASLAGGLHFFLDLVLGQGRQVQCIELGQAGQRAGPGGVPSIARAWGAQHHAASACSRIPSARATLRKVAKLGLPFSLKAL